MIIGAGGSPQHLGEIARSIEEKWTPAENEAARDYVVKHLKDLVGQGHETSLRGFETFLPPRLVSGAKSGSLVPFFGAGISVSAGVPTWAKLLEKLGVSPELTSEPHLENDPLTTAELLAHEVGSGQLQSELRLVMRKAHTPALVHHLLAQLAQPAYITTNYDQLFEIAWKAVHGVEPIVVTNDTDFVKHGLDPTSLKSKDGRPILLKVHGCAERYEEEMILTRSQYRRHYRSNRNLFNAVRALLESRHTLFLGFSHRDPEITRLVEDVIHRYEARGGNPALYSLQFDMWERTPEVFAARGIVALQPPLSLGAPDGFDYRSAGVTKALVDLLGAMDSTAHQKLDLDDELRRFVSILTDELESAMKRLADSAKIIDSNLDDEKVLERELDGALKDLGALAGQGVYLLRENGDIRCCAPPSALVWSKRKEPTRLHDRFYVRQAKTFREPFVSDSNKSVFNDQSTVFLCQPVGETGDYKGLLFAAAQVGAWTTPRDLKHEFLEKHPDASFVLVDSDGVVLLPPNDELKVGGPSEKSDWASDSGEDEKDNLGFEFVALKRLSRRDRLVSRVWRNIVPLAQDDDFHTFSDLKMYSVVSEVPPTRWKLALSIPLPATGT